MEHTLAYLKQMDWERLVFALFLIFLAIFLQRK